MQLLGKRQNRTAQDGGDAIAGQETKPHGARRGGDAIAMQETQQYGPPEIRREGWLRNVKLCEMLGGVGGIIYFCIEFL